MEAGPPPSEVSRKYGNLFSMRSVLKQRSQNNSERSPKQSCSLFTRLALRSIAILCCAILLASYSQVARFSSSVAHLDRNQYPLNTTSHFTTSDSAPPLSSLTSPLRVPEGSEGAVLSLNSQGAPPTNDKPLQGDRIVHQRKNLSSESGSSTSSANSQTSGGRSLNSQGSSPTKYKFVLGDKIAHRRENLSSESGSSTSSAKSQTSGGSKASAAQSSAFRAFSVTEKYLYYPRAGDWCKGSSHTTWSLSCALGDAVFLNRTYVLDMEFCVSAIHNGGQAVNRDVRLYFDIERMRRVLRVIPLSAFLAGWHKHDREHPDLKITVKHAAWHAPSRPLRNEPATILQRVAPANIETYAYEVCDVPKNRVIQRPWAAIWGFSPPLMDLAYTITAALGWDFDAVHVRRGDKPKDKLRWPNLDRDTQPARILQVLCKRVKPGRRVYIATNEYAKNFFKPLSKHYNVSILSDFSRYWARGSKWWKACEEILGPNSNMTDFNFDGIMKGMVDSVIFGSAKLKIETFYDLTSDDKHGRPITHKITGR